MIYIQVSKELYEMNDLGQLPPRASQNISFPFTLFERLLKVKFSEF